MIAYDRLSAIIPSNLALANKALAVALGQVSGLPNMTLPTFAKTVKSTNTNQGLPAINQQKQPFSVLLLLKAKLFLFLKLEIKPGSCRCKTIRSSIL